MRKLSSKDLTLAAMVAALYTVMCYFGNIFGLTYSAIQVRFAEALTVLPFLFPAAVPGLTIGCLIANLLSPYGPIDIIFGTLATLIAGLLTMKMPSKWLAPLPPILVNMAILSPIWAWAEANAVNGAFFRALAFHAVTFAIGEALACYVLGLLLLHVLGSVKYLQSMIPKKRLSAL